MQHRAAANAMTLFGSLSKEGVVAGKSDYVRVTDSFPLCCYAASWTVIAPVIVTALFSCRLSRSGIANSIKFALSPYIMMYSPSKTHRDTESKFLSTTAMPDMKSNFATILAMISLATASPVLNVNVYTPSAAPPAVHPASSCLIACWLEKPVCPVGYVGHSSSLLSICKIPLPPNFIQLRH